MDGQIEKEAYSNEKWSKETNQGRREGACKVYLWIRSARQRSGHYLVHKVTTPKMGRACGENGEELNIEKNNGCINSNRYKKKQTANSKEG